MPFLQGCSSSGLEAETLLAAASLLPCPRAARGKSSAAISRGRQPSGTASLLLGLVEHGQCRANAGLQQRWGDCFDSLNSPESSPQGLSLLLGRVEQHGSCSSISAFVQRSSWPNISLAFWVLRAFSLPTPHLPSLQTPACPYLAAHARFGQPYPGRNLLSAGTLCWHVVRHQIPVLCGAWYSCSL